MTVLVIGDPVALGYFLNAEDARRALNGLQIHYRDLSVQPVPVPVGGRSWCLSGLAGDMSEWLSITTVVERWNGIISEAVAVAHRA